MRFFQSPKISGWEIYSRCKQCGTLDYLPLMTCKNCAVMGNFERVAVRIYHYTLIHRAILWLTGHKVPARFMFEVKENQ